MKPAAHQYEDKLLELAYGELPAHEASAVESHVRTCARCTEALTEIRAVRSTMGQLPMVPVPDTGLDSLFAYADQAARRNAAGPAPALTWWRRMMTPLIAAGALSLIGIVAYQTSQSGDVIAKPAQIAEKVARDEAISAAPPPPAAVAVNEPAPQPAVFEDAEKQKPQAEPAVWNAAQAKAEGEREHSLDERKATKDVTAAKAVAPAKPMAGKKAGGEELQDVMKSAQKLSESKNKEAAATNYFDPKSGPPADKSGAKDDGIKFGVVQGGAGQRAPAPAEEQAKQPPPEPPQLAQQQAYPATPPSRTESGSMRMGLDQQQRGVASSVGSLGQRDRGDSAEKTRAGNDVPAAAVAPQQMVSNLKSQIDELRSAQRSSDTETELKIAQQMLSHNAKGEDRLEALNAMCTGLKALGRVDEAERFCQQMLREFPNSNPAQNYRSNQMRQKPAPAKRAKNEQYYEADDAKAAPPAPASESKATESAK